VLSGNIFALDGAPRSGDDATAAPRKENGGNPIVSLGGDEVYAGLEQFGYCAGDAFKTIGRVNIYEDGKRDSFVFVAVLRARTC